MVARTTAYLIQGNNIIVVIRGNSHNIGTDHAFYNRIKAAITQSDWDTVEQLLEPVKAVVKYGAGNVTIRDGAVYWRGEPVTSHLADHMLRLHSEGFPVDPLVNFMERLMKNPSLRSRTQCYEFITRNKMPITPDGYILAFKRVRAGSYNDIHSNTIRNKVGDRVEMPRSEVDDDPNSYCSAGLHFCSEEYLDQFGGKTDPIMIVRIDPMDVVSVPADANGSKARCCAYTVVAEVTGARDKALAAAVVTPEDPGYTGNTTAAMDTVTLTSTATDYIMANPSPTLTIDLTGGAKTACTITLPSATKQDTYRLVRKYDQHRVEATGLTKADAEALIERRIRQKRATLIMIKE